MYPRTTSRRTIDGSVVRYVQLAHNHCKDGVTQAQVLLNLGREDKLDPDGLRRLVASMERISQARAREASGARPARRRPATPSTSRPSARCVPPPG